MSAQYETGDSNHDALLMELLQRFGEDDARSFEHLLRIYISGFELPEDIKEPDFWDVKETENGGFYLYPSSRIEKDISFPNGKQLVVNARTLGVIATSYVLNHMAAFAPKSLADDYFEKLQDHVSSMKHAESILSAIH